MSDSKSAKMRTPLSKVRGLGSAKSGAEHFWAQRLSAAALVPLVVFLLASLIALTGADIGTVKAYMANPIIAILVLALIITGVYHMRLGMQVIIEDYVHSEPMKTLALAGNSFFAALIGIACAYAVLRIGFAA